MLNFFSVNQNILMDHQWSEDYRLATTGLEDLWMDGGEERESQNLRNPCYQHDLINITQTWT